jgi:uncharacterized membrane protein SirB2
VFEFAEWLQSTPLSVTIQSTSWVTPLLQSIHILMIGVVFVSILMIALRVLGRVRTDEAFAAVWGRFAPWMWTGMVVMAASGLILIIGEPIRQATALSFWLKMLLIVIGIASVLYFRRSLIAAPPSPGAEFPASARSVAVVTVLIWLAIIFLGRAIAYDLEVWGSLSLGA